MISHGEELKAVRRSVNWVTASMQANTGGGREGSILTSYANDDKAFWKEFRRELVKEGYSSSVLRKHKTLIRDYVKELDDRGALDEVSSLNEAGDTTIEEESNISTVDSDAGTEPSPTEASGETLLDHQTHHTNTRSTATAEAPEMEVEAENVTPNSHTRDSN